MPDGQVYRIWPQEASQAILRVPSLPPRHWPMGKEDPRQTGLLRKMGGPGRATAMSKSSKASSGQGQSPTKSPLQRLARDPAALRQTHAAVHRFVDQLEEAVQDAVDAARARRLAPIKGVAKVCQYLQRRYLPVGQVDEAGRRSPRKPTGLVVEPAFVPGLTCLDQGCNGHVVAASKSLCTNGLLNCCTVFLDLGYLKSNNSIRAIQLGRAVVRGGCVHAIFSWQIIVLGRVPGK